jgi:hypothetical protein
MASCAFMQTEHIYETLRTNDQRSYLKTGKTGQGGKRQEMFVAGLDYQQFISAALEEAHKSLRFEPTKDIGTDMRAQCAPLCSAWWFKQKLCVHAISRCNHEGSHKQVFVKVFPQFLCSGRHMQRNIQGGEQNGLGAKAGRSVLW